MKMRVVVFAKFLKAQFVVSIPARILVISSPERFRGREWSGVGNPAT
jgi:hypothetical protein